MLESTVMIASGCFFSEFSHVAIRQVFPRFCAPSRLLRQPSAPSSSRLLTYFLGSLYLGHRATFDPSGTGPVNKVASCTGNGVEIPHEAIFGWCASTEYWHVYSCN
jgi:hypothetical protein